MTNDGVPAIGMCAKVALGKLFIQRATDNAWNGLLRIADLTGLMDFFVGQANIRRSWQFFCLGRIRVARLLQFSAFLRRVVFISKFALSLGTAPVMVC